MRESRLAWCDGGFFSVRQNSRTGQCTGEYWVTSEYSRHSRHCASPGLLLVGAPLAAGPAQAATACAAVVPTGTVSAMRCTACGPDAHTTSTRTVPAAGSAGAIHLLRALDKGIDQTGGYFVKHGAHHSGQTGRIKPWHYCRAVNLNGTVPGQYQRYHGRNIGYSAAAITGYGRTGSITTTSIGLGTGRTNAAT